MMDKLHYFVLCSAVGFCAAGAAAAQTVANGINVLGSASVKFASGFETIAGNLYLPANYDASQKYPAIVVSHPWGGVKEQTAGLYAQRLAKELWHMTPLIMEKVPAYPEITKILRSG